MAEQAPETGQEPDAGTDPGRDFAALMSRAEQAAAPAPAEAPYGYTTDPETGERRPKKAAGRPRKAPSIDELRASKAAAAAAADAPGAPQGDRAPDPRRGRGAKAGSEPPEPAPDPEKAAARPGYITRHVNKLYRRAGKIVQAMDSDIGTAIIAATKNTAEADEPDDSIGAAWEEVCKVNPRIRRVVVRAIQGGAYGQLLWAHAPILLAILLKDQIRKHIPFSKLLEALADGGQDDEPGGDGQDGPPGGIAGLLNGLAPGDLEQLKGMAMGMATQMAGKAAA